MNKDNRVEQRGKERRKYATAIEKQKNVLKEPF
jgi:hypothetical protein